MENLVGYAQRDLAVPLFTEAAVVGTAVDVHAANAAAKIWCAEVNARVHSETCAVPDEKLESERELLSALPSLRLQIGPPPVTRKVDRLSSVRFVSARYSVPVRFIGRAVMLTQVEGRLVIVDSPSGEVVAEHTLAQPGTASVLDEHYDGARPAPNRGPRTEDRDREPLLSNRSVRSASARSGLRSVPRQSVTPGCPPSSSASCARRRARP